MRVILKRTLFLSILILFLAACGDKEEESKNNNSNEDPSTDESQGEETDTNDKPYRDIGETFELIGYYSDGPMDITVNDIWIEPAADHAEYIEEIYSDLEDEMSVTFVDMTVKNKGDVSIGFGDIIPLYTGKNTEVDFTYPKNDNYTDPNAIWDEELEAGEEINIIGAVILDEEYTEFESALTFNGHEPEEGNQVLHVPQEDRNSPIGVYDLEESIYPIDYGEDGGVEIIFHKVEKVDNVEGLEKENESDEVLAFDVTVTNNTKKKQRFEHVLPYGHTEEILKPLSGMVKLSIFHNEAGENIDVYNGPDAMMEPGETRKGTLYGSFDPGEIDQATLSYFPYTFLMVSDFSLQLKFNLD